MPLPEDPPPPKTSSAMPLALHPPGSAGNSRNSPAAGPVIRGKRRGEDGDLGGRRIRVGGGVIFLGILIAAAVLCLFVMLFGCVRGSEFSPDRFASRDYYYYRFPLFQLQVSPVFRTASTPTLAQYLYSHQLLGSPDSTAGSAKAKADTGNTANPKSSSDPWHQIQQYTWGGALEGDAAILYRYLEDVPGLPWNPGVPAGGKKAKNTTNAKKVQNDSTSRSDGSWENWTRTHDDLAKVLWPTVAKLARAKRYIFIPEVMTLARRATSSLELKQNIDEFLAKKFARAGAAAIQQELFEEAVTLFTQAIDLQAVPDPEYLRRRAEAHRLLGNTNDSDTDLRTAEEIEASELDSSTSAGTVSASAVLALVTIPPANHGYHQNG